MPINFRYIFSEYHQYLNFGFPCLFLFFMASLTTVQAQENLHSVSSLSLINTDSNQPVSNVGLLKDNANKELSVFTLSELPTNLSFRANVEQGDLGVGSVTFELNGKLIKTENIAPYAIAGDDNPVGNFNAWTLPLGFHTLVVTPYSEAGAGGQVGRSLELRFLVNAISVSLIDADSNLFVGSLSPLPYGVVLSLNELPSNLSLAANAADTIGSVQFRLSDGSQDVINHIENISPYAIQGDNPRGDFNTWSPGDGRYTLTVTTFTEANGVGESEESVWQFDVSQTDDAIWAPSAQNAWGCPIVADQALPQVPESCDLTINNDLNPGEIIQAIAGAGENHTICFASGLHRIEQPIIPKNGQRYWGFPGAVISGARDLTSLNWSEQGSEADRYYCVDDQVQDNSQLFGAKRFKLADGANPGDMYPEELFVNGETRLQRVLSPANMRLNQWYFDLQADRICIKDHPSNYQTIETSVAAAAISYAETSDVTVENLIFEKYASSWRRAIIGGWFQTDGFNWKVRHNEIRDGHGSGVNVSPGILIEHNEIHRIGNMGIHGTNRERSPAGQADTNDDNVQPAIIRNNYLHHNGVLDFSLSNEHVFKLSDCYECLVQNNKVTDNAGPGIWYDVDNMRSRICSNLVENNLTQGIFYEISYNATIAWNIVRNQQRRNGDTAQSIYISSSPDVTAANNITYGNHHESFIRAGGRGSGRYGHWSAWNARFIDNAVAIDSGAIGTRVTENKLNAAVFIDGQPDKFLPYGGISFQDNFTYVDVSQRFAWTGFSPSGNMMTATDWANRFPTEVIMLQTPPTQVSDWPNYSQGRGYWFEEFHYGPKHD